MLRFEMETIACAKILLFSRRWIGLGSMARECLCLPLQVIYRREEGRTL